MGSLETESFLDPKETALVVVDLQNDFCHENGACAQMGRDVSAAQEIVPNVQTLINHCRKNGMHVVFVQMTQNAFTASEAWKNRPRVNQNDSVSVCEKGSWGAEFYQVKPTEKDMIVEKHRYSAFIGTELDMILGNLNVKSLVLTGVATNVCVESTARDGFMMDYYVTLVKDGCAGYDEELHENTFKNISSSFGRVLSTQDILNVWETKKYMTS